MALNPDTLRLYLVTDPILCAGAGLLETVSAAVRGGVTFVQLRDKTADTRARIEAARALKEVLEGTGVPLVINDDIDAVLAADVEGVHLGQGDTNVTEARARLGRQKLIGLSCETVQQVRNADPAAVDYLGLGTVFPTATKQDHKPAIGFSGLKDMALAAALPNVAIGGLKAAHAADVFALGCSGIAVVSAICGTSDPEAAAARLQRAITQRGETG
jgi:thiamine-phosphate pyrophosphorylase